jgi:prepilin-type processing-associated H-X9-DG protein
LKQLGIALDLYKQEYDGRFPIVRASSDKEAPLAEEEFDANWSNLIHPYIKNGYQEANWEENRGAYFSGVFHCPNDPHHSGPSYAMNGWFLLGISEANVPYASDTILLAEKRGGIPQEHFTWWNRPWPKYPPAEGTSIAGLEDEINRITVAPGETERQTWSPQWERWHQAREAAGLQTRRHHGGSNWLFVDGHARWARLTALWGNATSTNQFWPTRR